MTEKVRKAGVAAVLAHPFRYAQGINDPLEKIKRLFSLFDAVEIMTPNHSEEEVRGPPMDQGLGIGGRRVQ